MLTRAMTCGILNGVGDVFCQLVVEKKSEVDLKRVFKFLMLVGVTSAVSQQHVTACHVWCHSSMS